MSRAPIAMVKRSVDLDGIPERQAEAIEEQVRYWKRRAKEAARQNAGELPVWKGRVIGRLSRVDLYNDE